MDDAAPIELLDFHPGDDGRILARRAGEPSIAWVQDIEDAFQAAASRGGLDVVATREIRDELLACGESPVAVRGLRVV